MQNEFSSVKQRRWRTRPSNSHVILLTVTAETVLEPFFEAQAGAYGRV